MIDASWHGMLIWNLLKVKPLIAAAGSESSVFSMIQSFAGDSRFSASVSYPLGTIAIQILSYNFPELEEISQI